MATTRSAAAVAVVALGALAVLVVAAVGRSSAEPAPRAVAAATSPTPPVPRPIVSEQVRVGDVVTRTQVAGPTTARQREGTGSLMVLARHQGDDRPAVGMHLRVVPLEETTQATRGPKLVTRMMGDGRGPSRFATTVALARARVGIDGTAFFPQLPPGEHVLRNDRQDPDVVIRIEPGVDTLLEYAVSPGVRVEGVVLRPDGSPVVGALVESWPNDGEVEIEPLATSDWAGRFVLADVRPSSRYGVRAEEHFASSEFFVDAKTPQTNTVVLVPNGCVLDGFVVTAAMQPIEGALVRVGFGSYGPRSLWARTDARGHFRLFGLDCDEYPVHVQAIGFRECRIKAVVETPAYFVLEPSGD